SDTPQGAEGCNNVPFAPSVSVTPDSTQADAPTGVGVTLHVPQSNSAATLASAHLRDAVVTLPEGLSINPPAADGLQGCTDAQFAKGTHDPIACPEASKVGTVEIDTPVLPAPLTGTIYLGEPRPDDP